MEYTFNYSFTPSGLKYSQHFFPHNFSSRANPKTGKKPHRPFLYTTSVLFTYTMKCLIVIWLKVTVKRRGDKKGPSLVYQFQ